MRNPRIVFGLLGFIAVATMAWAGSTEENPHWLTSGEIGAIVASEPPPPAPGSEAEKRDLQLELAAQAHRGAAQIAEARRDENFSLTLFLAPIVPGASPEADPDLFRLFGRLDRQVSKVMTKSKDHWHRPRPYEAHPDEIHALFPVDGYSYPSGHSMHAYVFAAVLGQIFPAHASAFTEQARKIAQSRVDAGVHYTTDIREGEVVARQIVDDLKTSASFQHELDAVKAEVAAQK